MSVSPKAHAALCEAMERLLSGRPERTDGALTKNNLFKEAGISRATMNRAADVLAEWDRKVARHPTTAAQDRLSEQLTATRAELADSRRQRRALQDQLDAAATVIALLAAENAALRERSAGLAPVLPLPRRATNAPPR